jgi:dienelactone hydrolase
LRVIFEDRKISGIPVIEACDFDVIAKRPVVLILHGLGGCKESNFREAYCLVKEGFFVSSFDAYGHGEWQDGAARPLTRMERIQDMPNIIINTVKMIDSLIESYRYNKRADYERVGLLGRSMGGMITYAYITGERLPNVKAAVPLVATPAWVKLSQTNPIYDYDAEKLCWFENYEPCRKFQKLNDLPLLMLNGGQDPRIPIADVRASFLEMQKYYRDPDLIRLIEYEEVGHDVTPQMLNEAFAWFQKYL